MVETTKRMAPYLPFKTFLSSLDALSQGVPPKLDRSLWRSQSGINQGLIMNAYRFFGLVDENDASTEDLNVLAKEPDKRPEVLQALIESEYLGVLKHDLTKATMKMLDDAFEEEFAVGGATKQKAIAFFLKAAKFSDMALSPYLLSQLRASSGKKKRGARQRNGQQENGVAAPNFGKSSGITGASHSVRLVGGGRLTISIGANPFIMPADDRNFFFSIVDMLHKYGQEHPEVQQVEDEEEEEMS